jgi:hypothetical protein
MTEYFPEPSGAGSAGEFIAELNALRAWAGKPSLRRLRDLAGRSDLPTSTTHEILSGKRLPRLPRLEFVEVFVRACLRARDVTGTEADQAIEAWRRHWRRLAAGTPPAADEAPSARTGRARRRHLPHLLIAGVCLLAGALTGALIARFRPRRSV